MTLNRSLILLLAACACFAIALLSALSVFHTNEIAWTDGGLLALALSFLP